MLAHILLLTLGKQDKATFLETIAALLNTADLREQAAIYSAFPLLPHQADLVEAAVDGLRSNIIDIFDSLALQNPFPATHFSKEEWNQMVLKAIFISRPIYKIFG
ncbi:MAG: EboA domain-containing protein, partial [Verrucomicrobiales bacterium]|nr:EboA domain-containing protein [Verrucomicrobiales bacterium]